MAKELRQIVRIGSVDVDGTKPVEHQLTRIRGVGVNFANLICHVLGLDRAKKAGELSDAEITRIEEALQNPVKFGAPGWMLNRRKDPETGDDTHLVTSTLKFVQDNDVRTMRKIKSYKGVRHGLGQPVRGQRTKSNFRKNKGKVQGVVKKKDASAAAPAKK